MLRLAGQQVRVSSSSRASALAGHFPSSVPFKDLRTNSGCASKSFLV